MSKGTNSENIASAFPYILSGDKSKTAISTAAADELGKLFSSMQDLSIYSRIDRLDEKLLDILAYDFKIDWYDYNADLEEKRQTVKEHWAIRRILGTPAAVKFALRPFYKNEKITIFDQRHNGVRDYHYKIGVDLDSFTLDYEKIAGIAQKIQYFANARSIFDGFAFSVQKNAGVFIGVALQKGYEYTATIAAVDPTLLSWYVDELGDDLTDENGVMLFDD